MARKASPVAETGRTSAAATGGYGMAQEITREKKTPEREAGVETPAFGGVEKVLKDARETFYKDSNVIGVGVGPRRVGGTVRPGENALLVYVLQKLPKSALDPQYVIPDEFEGLKTDVIAPLAADAPKTAVNYM